MCKRIFCYQATINHKWSHHNEQNYVNPNVTHMMTRFQLEFLTRMSKGIYQKRGGGTGHETGEMNWEMREHYNDFLPSFPLFPISLYSLYPTSDTGHTSMCTKRRGITAVLAIKDEKIWESGQENHAQMLHLGAAIVGKLGGINPLTHFCSNFYSLETLGTQNESYAYQDEPREQMRHFSTVRGYISA